MATITNIERLNYYEGEYLGAVDFDAEQEYHRDMRRRHNVGQHTWGIVAGLELAQVPNGGPNSEVDVYLMPGMAVDGFGREIVALNKIQLTQDPFAPYFDPNPAAKPKQMYLWIAYDQAMVQASQDTCASAGQSNAFGRVEESYKIAVTPDPTSPVNSPLTVDSASLSPGAPQSTPPQPGDIVLPNDGSVPYQEFSGDDQVLTWFIAIGTVLWDPHNEVFVSQPVDKGAQGRMYAGSVAETIYAPGGALTVLDRSAPFPLPSDPTNPDYPGVGVEIAGSLHVDRSLQVDGLLNALTNVLIGTKFDPTDKNALSPLTISASGTDEELIQFRTSAGRETWHICENLGGANPGINIGEIVQGKPVDGRLFIQSTISGASVPSTQNIGIGTLTPRNPLGIRGQGNAEELLSFEDAGGLTRWHLNQNTKGSLLGVPFTRGLNFAETNVADFRLFLQAGGNVGVGTPLPQQNLSVNGSLNIDQANANAGAVNPGLTFGSTSGEGIASNRNSGNRLGLDFYTYFALRMSITFGGRLGIGTTVPDSQVHLSGGSWDLTNTEGDFKIGNTSLRFKIGVALGGAGAGDARIRADGGTNRLMIGGGPNDTLTIQNQNVGINTITPTRALDVLGSARVTEAFEVDNGATINGGLTVNGSVRINGPLKVTGAKTGYVADHFIYRGSDPLERGDVVALHQTPTLGAYTQGRIPLIEVRLTDQLGDTCVCGIVDEPVWPADQLTDIDLSQTKKASVGLMVTLGAYSFCKVDATEGAVKPGDLLTAGSLKGHAVRASPKGDTKPGAIIGKALAPLGKGKIGIIPILVSHQ